MSKGRKLLLIITYFLAVHIVAFGQDDPNHVDSFNPDRVKTITQKDGLSSSQVNAILKDKKGFIWIGTNNGLNRFDGTSIKLFNHIDDQTGSIGSNEIKNIYEDIKGKLWIGTKNGLYSFDHKKQLFDTHELGSSQSKLIYSICEDKDGNLWVSSDTGLYTYIRETKKFDTVVFKDHVKVQGGRAALVLKVDSNGEMWGGSWTEGIYRINPITKEHSRYALPGFEQEDIFKTGRITTIAEGPDGSLWFGAWSYGLLRIYPDRNKVRIYKHNMSNSNSLNGDKIKSLKFDEKGYLWIGIEESGLDRFAPEEEVFTHYFNSFQSEDIYEGPSIYSILIDDQSLMWLGFRNDGIRVVPLFASSFESFPTLIPTDTKVLSLCEAPHGLYLGVKGGISYLDLDNNNLKSIKLPNNETPISLLSASNDELYVGTYKGSILRLDTKSWVFSQLSSPELEQDMMGMKIEYFYPINKKELLIGSEKGLYKLNISTGAFKKIVTHWIHSIMPADQQSLWITSYNCIFEYYPQTGKIIQHNNSATGDIKAILPAGGRKMFLGTDLGFYLQDLETGQVDQLSNTLLFKNSQVNAMLEDNQNNIWLASENRLIKYNPMQMKFRLFERKDGLPPMRFYDGVSLKLQNGQLAFGGDGGVLLFEPLKIEDKPNNANLTFTYLSIRDKTFDPIKKDMPMEQDISEIDHINLQYKQNIITFGFSLLSYINPEKHQYQYQLEGFNDNWLDLGSQKTLTFTNLSPGNYLLKLRAANEGNNWGPTTQLSIHVSEPLYQTWYAYVAYVLVIATIIFLIRQFYSNREKLKIRLKDEQIKFEKLKAKAIHESDFSQMRLKFFTNISHEFRTPLTLILGPLENFVAKKVWPKEEHLQLMHKNAERLQRLINQILDFRSMESKSLQFEPLWGNVSRFAEETAQLFLPLAQQKGLKFELANNAQDVYAWFDRDKLEKIIYNLLSNAHKHTQKGSIKVIINTVERNNLAHKSKRWKSEEYTHFLELTVIDSGEGIPHDKIPYIFDRFFHLQSNITSVQGTGIGLALTKELLDIHNGKIQVNSKLGVGSEFKVTIPLKTIRSSTDEGMEDYGANGGNFGLAVVEDEPANNDQSLIDLPIILIVEDNEDLRKYIQIEFANKYTVIEADNGETGLNLALNTIPDLIISDLMMPKMDGIEFCKAIKKDEKTSHIPIIILTAHSSQFNQIQGYEIGADDYMTKPFSSELLVLRVENLLKGRKELQSKFSREVRLEPKDLLISSMDERFLTKAMEVVETNLNDSEFSADSFASEMCMSRVHLYRKLKALTDQSVSDFVKTARLKLAAKLIGDNKLTIKEAAYTVGFKDPKYFSKCFKQQFGVKPSDYSSHYIDK